MPDATLSKSQNITAWIAQVVAAGILAIAAVGKITSHPDSIALFTTLGVEPWGRWAVGVAELGAIVLLLGPRTAAIGGALAAGLMVGALGSHVTKLGISYGGDASLFGMALVVLAASGTVAYLRRRSLPGIGA